MGNSTEGSTAALPAAPSENESDIAHALRWGGGAPSMHVYRQLASKLQALDRGQRFTGERVQDGLFDFQAACASWLCARVAATPRSEYSLIEMGAGCGKTRALGAFLKRCELPSGRPALYVTPGGLVRQTTQELGRIGLACCKAESTKEFLRHTKMREGGQMCTGARVIVVNVAIPRTWLPFVGACSCLVLDEAHRLSQDTLRRVGLHAHTCAVVLATATPTGGGAFARLAHAAAPSQHFVMFKTPVLASALNMSGVRLVANPQPQPAEDCHRAFLDALSEAWSGWLAVLVLLAVASSDMMDDPVLCEAGVANSRVTDVWKGLWARQLASERREGSFTRRIQHASLGVPALLDAAATSGDLSHEVHARMREQCLGPPLPAHKNARPVCHCCGLQEEEIQGLAALQRRFLPPVRTPCPGEWDIRHALFVRAILRLPSAEEVLAYRSRVDSQKGCAGGFECFYVSSDLSAAQRAIRVRAFSRPRSCPAAFALLSRSSLGSKGSAGEAVGRIGQGELLAHIFALAADRALLVCDARCGDVGYNLQCTTHMVSPHIPRSSEDVLQLTGRSSRITAGSKRASVDLICMPRRGTGEALVLRHVQQRTSRAPP